MNKYRFKCTIPPYGQIQPMPMPFAPVLLADLPKKRRLLVSTRIHYTCVPESWKDPGTMEMKKIKKIRIDDLMNISSNLLARTRITFLNDDGEKQWISPEIDVYFSKDLDKDCGIFGTVDIFNLWEKVTFTKDIVEYIPIDNENRDLKI